MRLLKFVQSVFILFLFCFGNVVAEPFKFKAKIGFVNLKDTIQEHRFLENDKKLLMDKVLELYFEQKLSPEEIIAIGNDRDLTYLVLNKVESPANEFKRQELPPTIIISKNAIGVGRRRPITHKYRRNQH